MSINAEWTSADALTPEPFKKFTAYKTVPVTYDTTTSEYEAAYRKGYRAGLDASRGVCTPVTKGSDTTCSVCGSGGIVKEWTELRGWGGELVHMHVELWPYCPQCGAKLMEVDG